MTATYFNRNGSGHSIRGTLARDQGAMAWSKLPATLRRSLTSKQAESLVISFEWHHAGKYAARVPVYYIPQVEAFWAVLDTFGATNEQIKAHAKSLNTMDFVTRQKLAVPMAEARETAENVRLEITEE